MRPRPTARLRLTLLYGALFLAAGAILLGLNYALVRQSLERSPDFTVSIPPPEPPEPPEPSPPPEPREPPVTALEEITAVEPPPPEPVPPPAEEVADLLDLTQRRLLAAALDELVVQSALALGVMAVASIGLGWLVAGRVLRPVHEITAVARRLSEQNLHERIGLVGPRDELKELADTFDTMLGRLEGAFEAQRRFVANASHELRTPLAIARTEVDVTLADPAATNAELRAMAETVREATDRSERLIDGLLVLARSEQTPPGRDPIDLAVAAARAVAQAHDEAAAAGVQVAAALAPAPVAGDRVLLERLVANLVENGVRHNRPGGWVRVATGVADGHAAVRVASSGPTVPTDRIDELFEPFRRLGADRTKSARGAGLGLSIVRAVATAHGGAVNATPVAEGGLEVAVVLPSAGRPRR